MGTTIICKKDFEFPGGFTVKQGQVFDIVTRELNEQNEILYTIHYDGNMYTFKGNSVVEELSLVEILLWKKIEALESENEYLKNVTEFLANK